jgi:hypothetical protein
MGETEAGIIAITARMNKRTNEQTLMIPIQPGQHKVGDRDCNA